MFICTDENLNSETTRKRLRTIQSSINTEFEFVEFKITKLETLQSEWNMLVNKIETTVGAVQNPIKLNVMGKVFCVSKETLMSMENTYFYGLVANMDKFKPLDDGTYFIERDPLVFGRILNYLRTGKMDTRDLSPYAVEMLKDDFDYYCIPLPVELKVSIPLPVELKVSALRWDFSLKPINCSFSNDNLTAAKISGGNMSWNCNIIGNTAVNRYTVRIDNRGAGEIDNRGAGEIMIGFTTGTTWKHASNTTNGWFINVRTGSLYGIGVSGSVYSTAGSGYSTAINQGDYITVIRQGTTIRFEKNKIDLGICQPFTGIPDQTLFPAIDMLGMDALVMLINDY